MLFFLKKWALWHFSLALVQFIQTYLKPRLKPTWDQVDSDLQSSSYVSDMSQMCFVLHMTGTDFTEFCNLT